MKKGNLLLICYGYENIEKTILNNKNNFTIYIASYDISFLNEVKKNKYVKRVFSIEKNITIFDVSSEVVSVIEDINQELTKYFTKELKFSRHVEGGYTSQAIQDTILFKKSIESLIYENKITHIFDFYCREYYKQSQYTMSFAEECNIEYKRKNFNFIKSLFIFNKIKIYLYEPYKLFHFIKIYFRKNNNKIIRKNSIVFSLHSDKMKFINLLNKISTVIDESNDYNSVYLTQSVSKDSKNMAHLKGDVIMLENYMCIADFFKSFCVMSKNLKIWFKNKDRIMKSFEKYGCLLENEIKGAIFANIVIDSAYKYRYIKAIDKFLSINNSNIMAFQLWGGISLFEGASCAELIKDRYTRIRTIFFCVGFGLKHFPYFPLDTKNLDYMLVDTLYEKNIHLYQNYTDNQVVLLENFKFDVAVDKTNYSKSDLLNHINVKDKYKLYILVDIQVHIPGLINLQELLDFMLGVRIMSNKYKKYLFLIKPHPAFKNINLLNNQLKNISNIKIFNRNYSIHKLLYLADVVVTKFSTIGVEAILLNKLVISVINNESKWKNYENGAIYVDKFEDISDILDDFSEVKINMKKNIENFQHQWSTSRKSTKIENFIHSLK
jgi:hypothetical protein